MFGSGYQYVKDSTSTAFFKLPTSWALFDEDEILSVSPRPTPVPASVAQALWMVGFDANGIPSLTHVLSAGYTQQPAGFAQVQPRFGERRA